MIHIFLLRYTTANYLNMETKCFYIGFKTDGLKKNHIFNQNLTTLYFGTHQHSDILSSTVKIMN